MDKHEKINYVEFPIRDIPTSKAFFSEAFGWSFVDYGPEYAAITGAGLDGGLIKSNHVATSEQDCVLVVLYSENLEHTLSSVENAGGMITRPIFSFPGGRRFQFIEPGGNELAVWSDIAEDGSTV